MPRYCAYKNCNANSITYKNRHFYSFPVNEKNTVDIWIQNCNKISFLDLSDNQLKNKSVCDVHFKPNCFINSSTKYRICKSAVPTEDGNLATVPNLPALSLQKLNNIESLPGVSNRTQLPITPPKVFKPSQSTSSKLETELTPRKIKLRKTICSQKKLLSLKRASISRLKNANQIISGKDVALMAKEKFPPTAATFLAMQFQHTANTSYTKDEKQFALSCYYKSPALYVHLKEMGLKLPSVSSISAWIDSIPMKTGTNEKLLHQLAMKVESISDPLEKQVVLMFDEMSIRMFLQYNQKNDRIEGIQDLGSQGRSSSPAKQALVFMIRGLFIPWKLPVSYYFASSNVKSINLKPMIEENLENLNKVGLRVRALVCDQGSNNRAALNKLGVTEENMYIVTNEKKVHVIHDVPHLIKNVRNHLISKDIQFEDRRASWKDIEKVYELDNCPQAEGGIPKARALVKIRQIHISPKNFQKMAVKYATQVLSHSMESAILTAVSTKQLISDTALGTAEFVGRINNVFDALNSKTLHSGNPFSRALSEINPQVEEYLKEAAEFVDSWKVVGGKRNAKPFCFTGLSNSIRSTLCLWSELKQENISFLMTSKLNQDPIENLFSILRQRGGCNPNPSALQFKAHLKAFMSSNLLKPSRSSNCEPDNEETMTLNEVFPPIVKENVISSEVLAEQILEDSYESGGMEDDSTTTACVNSVVDKHPTLESCSVRYVAGYLAYKIEQKFHCKLCKNTLTKCDANMESGHDYLIFHRAYLNKGQDDLGNLKSPTDMFTHITDLILETFIEQFPDVQHQEGIVHIMLGKALRKIRLIYPHWLKQCKKHKLFALSHLLKVRIHKHLQWTAKVNIHCLGKPTQKMKNVLHQ